MSNSKDLRTEELLLNPLLFLVFQMKKRKLIIVSLLFRLVNLVRNVRFYGRTVV
jgi:hypothetical protein